MEATNWRNKDPYIIKNYKNMTYKEIAENLSLKYTTLYSRIKILKKRGIIEGKETIRKPEPTKLKFKNLKIGKKYKIKYIASKKNKNGTSRFEGILMDEINGFYVFKSVLGYTECFLKKDFAIGEYKAEEVG